MSQKYLPFSSMMPLGKRYTSFIVKAPSAKVASTARPEVAPQSKAKNECLERDIDDRLNGYL